MQLGNWVRATTATTGTGSLTLSAVSGYPSPSTQFAQGERFSYVLLDDSTVQPTESGIGYLDGSGLLVREVPLAKHVSGTYSDATANAGVSAVSLSGTTRVICAPLKTSGGNLARRGRSTGTLSLDIFHPVNFTFPTTGSTNLSSSGRSFYVPVLLDFAHPVDAFVIYPSATVGNTDLGIFSVKADGDPGDLLLGWSNKATSANVTNAFTFASADVGRWSAATRLIPPGWYWVSLNASVAMTFSRLFYLYQHSLLPMDNPAGRTTCLINTRTQGTLPQPAPTGMGASTISGSSDVVTVPYLGFRRAA